MEAETTESGFAQEVVKCSFCKESFAGKTPYLLTCFHGICRQCCDSIGDGQNEQKIKCTVCNMDSNKNEIIANKFVKTALPAPAESSQSQSEEKYCTGCDEESVPATSFCVECQEYLCDQCVQAHRRVKITKEHHIQSKDNAPAQSAVNSHTDDDLLCHIHPKEQLKLFCETCDKLTCRDCQLSEHKDHKYYFVEEAGVKMRSILTKLLEKMRDKKTYIEKSKSLISHRRSEIQECQHRVSNDIKNFAMKTISEVNKRGKSIMEDLTSLCNAKKQQLDEKGSDLSSVSKKLDHALQFIEFCTEKGTPEALLYSKRILVKHLKEILQARCDVPNPNHKLDIRFNWDTSFASVQIPKQGVLLVDGINYEGLSKSAQRNLVQGSGFQNSQQPGIASQYVNLTREQQQAVMMKTRQQYVQQQQQRSFLPGSRHGNITPPSGSMTNPSFLGGGLPHSQHQGMMMGSGFHPSQYNKPHQSAAINSSSDPLSRARPGMPAPYPNLGNPVPSSSGHFPPPHMQQHAMQSSNSQQQPGYQNRLFTLAELQEQRVMMRKQQQGTLPSGAPPPSPIVIAPEGEEHSRHLMPSMSQRSNPVQPAVFPATSRPNTTSPHGSNTSSPVHVGSTTSNSPEQRPRSRTMESEASNNSNKSRLKGESTERPSCSFSISPKPSQVDKQDKNKGQLSINDFTFDQDPMSFIKNINQEIDLNPEKTLGLLNTRSSQVSNEAASTSQSKPSSASSSSTAVPSNVTETERSDVVGSTGNVSQGKGSAHIPTMLSSQESDPNEDWCAVCNNGGDLLCCDECPKVFHLTCHVPSLKQNPSGHWSCNMCKKVEDLKLHKPDSRESHTQSASGGTKRKLSTGLTDRESIVCQRILLELYSQESSLPFHEPVSKSVPNYYKIITYPMDFSTIKNQLRRSSVKHYSSVEEFLMDIQLVFSNCARYNAASSEMGIIGKKMEAFFHSLVRKFLPYIDIQPVNSTTQNSSASSANNQGDTIATSSVTPPPTTAAAKGDSHPATNSEEEQSLAPPKAKLLKTLSIEENSLISGSSDKEDDLNSSSGSHKENKNEGRQKLKLKLKASYKLVSCEEEEEDKTNEPALVNNKQQQEEGEESSTPETTTDEKRTENGEKEEERSNESSIVEEPTKDIITDNKDDTNTINQSNNDELECNKEQVEMNCNNKDHHEAMETDSSNQDNSNVKAIAAESTSNVKATAAESTSSPITGTPQESTSSPINGTPQESTSSPINETPQDSTSSPINETPQDSTSSPINETPQESTSSPINRTPKEEETSNNSQGNMNNSLDSSILSELPDLGGDETESLESTDDEDGDPEIKAGPFSDPDFVPSLELELTDSEKTPVKD